MRYFLLILLMLPWVVTEHFPPWFTAHAELPAFCAILLFFVVILRSKLVKTNVTSGSILIIFVCFFSIGQYVFNKNAYLGDALTVILYGVSFLLAWVLGAFLAVTDKPRHISATLVAIVLVGLVLVFQIFAQWLQIEGGFNGWVIDGLVGARPRGNIGQPNHAGTMLVIACVSTAMLREKGIFSVVVFYLVELFLLLAITLTQSRTAILSILLAIFGFIFYGFFRPTNRLLRREVLVVGAVAVLLAIFYASSSFTYTQAAVREGQLVNVGTRPTLWMQLIHAVLEKPWFGWGWMRVSEAQQFGARFVAGTEQIAYAHNILLDVLVAVGVPVGFVVVGFSMWWIFEKIKTGWNCSVVIGSFFLLLPILVHSFLEMPHAYAYFLLPSGILLGVIDVRARSKRSFDIQVPLAVLGFFWGVVVILGGGVVWEYFQAEEDFRINRFENMRVGHTPSDYLIPNLYLLTQLDELARAMRIRESRNMSMDDLQLLKRVSLRYTWSALQYRTAVSWGVNGYPDVATERLNVVKNLFPAVVFDEVKESFLLLANERYPELKSVVLPQ